MPGGGAVDGGHDPSMKCSPPKELQGGLNLGPGSPPAPSMKCSPRRNCKPTTWLPDQETGSLNEVQSPKELQAVRGLCAPCDVVPLNEVQSPKELQAHRYSGAQLPVRPPSMKCSPRRNCKVIGHGQMAGNFDPQ